MTILLIKACDGSDCIHPSDFGNLGVYSLKLSSNPFTEAADVTFKDVVISSSDDIKAKYEASAKSCGTEEITSDSKIYHWVDTGIDIVDINRKISLKVAGSANFVHL